jgi:hypothetical protein
MIHLLKISLAYLANALTEIILERTPNEPDLRDHKTILLSDVFVSESIIAGELVEEILDYTDLLLCGCGYVVVCHVTYLLKI